MIPYQQRSASYLPKLDLRSAHRTFWDRSESRDAQCMVHLPIFGLSLWYLNVGKYTIHRASGYVQIKLPQRRRLAK